jgi:acyl-CoA thioester hydrolase
MAKPDPSLLDPARYSYSCVVETRYRDLDTNRHINNGAMASLFEEARLRFHRHTGFQKAGAVAMGGLMVASLGVEFLGQSHYPDPLEVHIGFSRMGNSSYDLAQVAHQNGVPVAFCRTTIVSTREGRPCPFTEQHRALAQQWMITT